MFLVRRGCNRVQVQAEAALNAASHGESIHNVLVRDPQRCRQAPKTQRVVQKVSQVFDLRSKLQARHQRQMHHSTQCTCHVKNENTRRIPAPVFGTISVRLVEGSMFHFSCPVLVQVRTTTQTYRKQCQTYQRWNLMLGPRGRSGGDRKRKHEVRGRSTI